MFNIIEIESEMIQRAKKRAKLKTVEKPARFGAAMYFRRFKKIKPKNFDRVEPPILKQTNPFKGESAELPSNFVKKGFKRPQVNI